MTISLMENATMPEPRISDSSHFLPPDNLPIGPSSNCTISNNTVKPITSMAMLTFMNPDNPACPIPLSLRI